MDPVILQRLLASILAQRLIVVCGAELSMGRPTTAPSAKVVSQVCFDSYAASTGAALGAALRDDLEKLADYFYDNHTLQSVFRQPNRAGGHAVAWWPNKSLVSR